MGGFDDDERVALRASLGFSDLRPKDAFSELARRAQPSEPEPPAEPEAAVSPTPAEALERIEDQLAAVAAAITGLTSRVAGLEGLADIGRQLEEVVESQRALALRLADLEVEVCRVTHAGFERIATRFDTLEATSGKVRRSLDRLRRQAGGD